MVFHAVGKSKESESSEQDEGDGELDLTGIDDDEIDSVKTLINMHQIDMFARFYADDSAVDFSIF